MTVVDLSVTPTAITLLDCLSTAVSELDSPPAHVGLRPGPTVDMLMSQYEDECCNGLAWVRLSTVYPSSSFPEPDAAYTRCAPLAWAAVFELGIVRCAPVPDATSLVSVEEWNALTGLILADAAALRRTICCLAAADPDRMVLAGAWAPLPVEGGCVGGTQQVTVAVDGDCDCSG